MGLIESCFLIIATAIASVVLTVLTLDILSFIYELVADFVDDILIDPSDFTF